MDAFDKLAKLAGASVESVGEGLPRTRAEAKALGVARYFTGKPCSRGHVTERGVSSKTCCECALQLMRRWRATPEGKECKRQYCATPNYRWSIRQYNAKPEVMERSRQRQLAKVGDAVLFAINQAGLAARRGRAANDIGSECPEPQRSQLQVLVDRIKADPQAGKAVVGLLQTMRELRKAELAEMKAAAEGGAA